jgi:integrase
MPPSKNRRHRRALGSGARGTVRQAFVARRCDPLRWGLIPYWYEDPKGGRKPINAKCETVDMPRANRVWTEEELKTVAEAAPKNLLAPILLCGILGWREGEAVTAPRTAYNQGTGELVRVSAKSGKVVPTPTPKTIVTAIEAIFPHDATTLLVSSTGRPWTLNGFRSSFFQLIRKLEKKGQVEPGLTCHGLRHTAATRLREGGFHLQTIADFLGQDTQGMAAHYSRDADLKGEMRKGG